MQKEVWLHFTNREKAMLLSLDEKNLDALTKPDEKVVGFRVNQKGEKSIVGFNSNDITTFEYKLDEKDSLLQEFNALEDKE